MEQIFCNPLIRAGNFLVKTVTQATLALVGVQKIKQSSKGKREMKNMLPKLCLAASLGWCAGRACGQLDRVSSYPSANALSNKNFVEMAKEISAATGGKVNIAANFSGSLGIKEADMTAASQGVLDSADDGFFVGSIFEGAILRLPMLINSPENLDKGLDAVRPYVEKALAERNIVRLPNGPIRRRWCGQLST